MVVYRMRGNRSSRKLGEIEQMRVVTKTNGISLVIICLHLRNKIFVWPNLKKWYKWYDVTSKFKFLRNLDGIRLSAIFPHLDNQNFRLFTLLNGVVIFFKFLFGDNFFWRVDTHTPLIINEKVHGTLITIFFKFGDDIFLKGGQMNIFVSFG